MEGVSLCLLVVVATVLAIEFISAIAIVVLIAAVYLLLTLAVCSCPDWRVLGFLKTIKDFISVADTRMLIEFVGCSGAGKTTLATAVRAALLERGCKVAYSPELVAHVTKSAWLRNERFHNMLISVLLLPWLGQSRRVHRSFYDFAFSVIRRDAENVWERSSRTRSMIRQACTFDVLRSFESQYDFVLVDECTLGSAHNLFVHVHRPPRNDEVQRFATLVPMPDIVVHVDVDTQRALQRTLGRGDPPIRRGHENNRFERFIQHGRQVYEYLAHCPELSHRVVTAKNSSDDREAITECTGRLVQYITESRNADERRS